MKLTDFLQDTGRPVAYYPKLRRITGSTNATIFLCQLIYWKGKEADPQGWIYKTAEEMQEETGLSYDEQKTAHAKLKEAGLVEEHYARLDHQMKFRLNLEAIDTAWGHPVPESRNAMFGKAETPNSLNRNTENTTQTTPEDMEEIKTEANKKVDAILSWEGLGYGKVKGWKNRKLFEHDQNLVNLADAVVQMFGEPTKSECFILLNQLQNLIDNGVTVQHLKAAVDEAKEKWSVKPAGLGDGLLRLARSKAIQPTTPTKEHYL